MNDGTICVGNYKKGMFEGYGECYVPTVGQCKGNW